MFLETNISMGENSVSRAGHLMQPSLKINGSPGMIHNIAWLSISRGGLQFKLILKKYIDACEKSFA